MQMHGFKLQLRLLNGFVLGDPRGSWVGILKGDLKYLNLESPCLVFVAYIIVLTMQGKRGIASREKEQRKIQ